MRRPAAPSLGCASVCRPDPGHAKVMSRRAAVAGLSVLMLPTRGWTQPIAKPKRVGVLGMWAARPDDENWTSFVKTLAELGWTEGRQLVFERRDSQSHATGLDEVARELVRARVDVIYAVGGTAPAQAAQRATSTIPIVFHGSTDPVGMGLVTSLAKPGANVTGNASLAHAVPVKSLQTLAQWTGRPVRMAYVMPGEYRSLPWVAMHRAELTRAAAAMGGSAEYVDVARREDLADLLPGLQLRGINAVIFNGWTSPAPDWPQIAALCLRLRLMCSGGADDGFLLQYSVPEGELARRAARYVDRILRGVRPADLPVEIVSDLQLTVNARSAQALGLGVPQWIRLRATKVVE
jgi:putative tryptophan/tyrosine transport system substrate-binding protein